MMGHTFFPQPARERGIIRAVSQSEPVAVALLAMGSYYKVLGGYPY